MQKKQKLILFTIGLSLILLSILLLQKRNKAKKMEQLPPIEEEQEFVLQNAFPEDMILNPQQESVLDQVSELKNLSPVSTPNFSIEYSYKTGGFVVKSNKNLSATEKELEMWLNNNGFGNIEAERFEYQSSKLAL